jgi:hypothetical protein
MHVEVGDLFQGVDARIGTSGTHEFKIAGADRFCDRTDQFALDGSGILLYLPARIARTFVLYGKTKSH